MAYDKQALETLLAKVVLGNVLALDLIDALGMHPTEASSIKGGSMDSAFALLESELSGWLYWGGYSTGVPRIFYYVWHPDAEWEQYKGRANNPCHSLLEAILRALIAQEDTQ